MMAGTTKRSRKDIDPWQGIRQLREKAKELQHTEYEPYTAMELMQWAQVSHHLERNREEACDKAEDSWLRFIKKTEGDVRAQLQEVLKKTRKEYLIIREANRQFKARSRFRTKRKAKKTHMVQAKIERIAVEEIQKYYDMRFNP